MWRAGRAADAAWSDQKPSPRPAVDAEGPASAGPASVPEPLAPSVAAATAPGAGGASHSGLPEPPLLH